MMTFVWAEVSLELGPVDRGLAHHGPDRASIDGRDRVVTKETVNLRERLKSGTREDHAKLDCGMSRLDLRERADYASFLRVNEAGLAALARSSLGSEIAEIVSDLSTRCRSDLDRLGFAALPELDCPKLDALAVEYVVLGSRLGNKVLKKRWSRSSDLHVQSASAYFDAPEYLDKWREFLTGAAAVDHGTAVRIVDDARSIFRLFHVALVKSLQTETHVDEYS